MNNYALSQWFKPLDILCPLIFHFEYKKPKREATFVYILKQCFPTGGLICVCPRLYLELMY
jgi:hypothetical protein